MQGLAVPVKVFGFVFLSEGCKHEIDVTGIMLEDHHFLCCGARGLWKQQYEWRGQLGRCCQFVGGQLVMSLARRKEQRASSSVFWR